MFLTADLKTRQRTKPLRRYRVTLLDFMTNVDDWGKKRFAYDIQKQKEGFYYFIKFESEDATCPNELEAHVRIMEPVVRYLVVKQEA